MKLPYQDICLSLMFLVGITALWKMADCRPDPVRAVCSVAGTLLTGSIASHPLLTFPPDDGGPGSKRPKLDLSEEELKVHVSSGTLGKLTVPMLKEACRVYGLKAGTRKQELLDALTRHFQKD